MDTTTDEVRLFDLENVPPTHRADVTRLIQEAFVVGTRNLTKGIDLGGRVFLHQVEPILAGLRPLFDRHSGVMFVTDVAVSRQGYFGKNTQKGSGP